MYLICHIYFNYLTHLLAYNNEVLEMRAETSKIRGTKKHSHLTVICKSKC